jgi:peptidoglycan/LPS O-acetylase OafA/YrhL
LRRHAQALQTASAAAVAFAPLRGLAFLGRWSLSYYMLHQPVLIAVFSLVALLR